MSINKYLPFAILYFFFNSAGLPFGLTYTALLAPFFYWWIIVERKKEVLMPFLICMLPILLMHFMVVGVEEKTYFISLLNLAAVYIFCQAFYTFLKRCHNIEKIFRWLLVVNFFLCLAAIAFYFTPYREAVWIKQQLTEGVEDFFRLKLFTYEASYYATLFIPVFFFFFTQIMLGQNKWNVWFLLSFIAMPMVLSFALGVIACLLMAITAVFSLYFFRLMQKRRVLNIMLLASIVIIPVAGFLLFYFPDNIIGERLANIFSGRDSSGRGRTYEAFTLASQMVHQKSEWWGIGPGQIKIFGMEIIRDFYLYPLDHKVFTIPNATAETWAIFGWTGLAIRFLIEGFLFFYTKVWSSYFRMFLFVFIFCFQFAGSFITNIAEYVIWILAFTEVFPRFRIDYPSQQLTNQ